eukprot:11238330-Prorocentrum_lima.AAC.1
MLFLHVGIAPGPLLLVVREGLALSWGGAVPIMHRGTEPLKHLQDIMTLTHKEGAFLITINC